MNKNHKLSNYDIISLFVFIILLTLILVFYNCFIEKKSQLNLENVECDYIALISDENEYNDLKNNQYAKKVVPYYYFNASVNNGSTSNLYIIDSFENINYTTFSEELLIKSSNKNIENNIYIDETVSKKFKLKLNDNVKLSFANSTIEYTITRIYKSDLRNIDGSMMVECTDITKENILNYYNHENKFKGAFVISSNQNELEKQFNVDFINLNDLSEKRNIMFKSDITLFNLLFVIFIVVSLIFLFCVPYIKNIKYIKKNLQIDFNSKFTLIEELKMFNKYNLSFGILSIFIVLIILIVPILQEIFYSYTLRSIIYSGHFIVYLLLCALCIILNTCLTSSKIKKLYK